MKRSLRRVAPLAALVVPAALATAVPADAGAQQPKPAAGPTCDVDQNKPGSLATAVFTITRVQASTDTAARQKALREAVGKITGDANAAKSNPVGTALTLGQAFALLAQDVALANGATRGTLGLGGDASARADLLGLVDSTLTVVEQAKPGCAEQAGQLRQFAWLNTMNAALAALNAQKMDSAQFFAERSLTVYKQSALPYYVLSVAAQTKGDMKLAATYWPRIMEATANDTTQTGRELRVNAMYNMAATASQEADVAQGEEQKAKAKAAADAVRAFLAANPTHPDAPRLQATLARMVTLTGDLNAISAVYADQLANPAKYNDLALTQAGVIASQAGKHEDAAKLFSAALEQSRYQRDALNNLAATYMQLKRYEPMLPVAQRLIEVDPANPDNFLFIAIAYQGLSGTTKAPAQKKAYTDSLLKYNKLSQDMPMKVTFSEFSRGDQRAALVANVEAFKKDAPPAARPAAGARAAAKPAAAAAKTYTLSIDFLDKDGNVVDTQTAAVGPVAPGETKQARVEVAKPGIVAFRYKVAG